MRIRFDRVQRAALAAAALTVALAAALVASLLAAAARGAVAGPSLNIQLGSYALVARTTEHPACLPLPQQCFIPRPTFQIPQPLYYTVWVGQITYPVRQGRQSPLATVRGREILRLPVTPPAARSSAANRRAAPWRYYILF